MAFVIGVILFAIGIGVSIALHELGHLAAAKAFRMKVTEYFVGMGPKIFSFRRGETEYGLRALPVGGYCRITGMTSLDEVDPVDAPRAMNRKPVWQRVVVLCAGSATHFMLAFVILLTMAVTMGLPNISGRAVVAEASSCVPPDQDLETYEYAECTPGQDPAPARDAGVLPGDEIVAVNGEATGNYTEVQAALVEQSGDSATITVLRDGSEQELTIPIVPVQRVMVNPETGEAEKVETNALGVSFPNYLHFTAAQALPGTLTFTGEMFVHTWERLLELPSRVPAVIDAILGAERDPNTPVSMVGASIIGGDAVAGGYWELFLFLLATLNLFIGVFNLLPLLPLDGGHVAVNLYEKARDTIRGWRGKAKGAPVDYTKLLPITYAAVFIGGAFMLLTLTADIVNPIRLR
ncbi:RIP metalloprotease RseP [Actinoalloteichus cyanogriseus DSM 43889]|uniref:RIP metalloprotease RseP n=1 Tax=Actinoalloteichus caeruleus DSM 43889 TaxID=1120930 RepID=A0ABT1JPC5_ACTCY|nr:site-2 protease family protein [Actinoalloteichus caeruleus]MCP2334377.1 RIP metalloprotease RseP [Actinoalloteichus caeruleus DSM 43889]